MKRRGQRPRLLLHFNDAIVFSFAKIVGGKPATVSGMTNHLLNETQTPEAGVLAQHYTRGKELGEETMRVADLARRMVNVPLTQAAGIEIMAAEYDQRGGDPELAEAYRDRIGRRLDVIAERIRDGIELVPIAIIRPDINPAVVVGLGIDQVKGD